LPYWACVESGRNRKIGTVKYVSGREEKSIRSNKRKLKKTVDIL
jgi:hypothetical protein